MANIAVLGTGAMGSRMAANLLKAGHSLTVWNRTPAALEPLLALGATAAATPKEAATGAEFVIAMVRDDDASRQVWLDAETGALAGMNADAVAIESSTLTPGWVRELGAALAGSGVALLEAPVSGSRPAAEAGQLVYLAGGEALTLTKAEPLLRSMGSAIHHVGPLGTGALVKLATNALLGAQVTVLAELTGMLKRAGADPAQAMQAIAGTPVWAPVMTYLSGTMLAQNFAPQFPVELIEKDFGYTVQTAGGDDAAPTIAAARAVFQRGIDAGIGGENMTAVASLFDPKVMR